MTHHSVMTSSLLIKISKIDNFGDFSCDIDYNSRADVFRDVISHIQSALINTNTDKEYNRIRSTSFDSPT